MLFADKVAHLETDLEGYSGLCVALSGGVDSAVLLGAAVRARCADLLAVTARSPAVPEEEVEAALRVAAQFAVSHLVVDTDELSDPRYRANAGDRCYFCRRAMYSRMREAVMARGARWIADGLQADDSVADRPGVRAAAELEVIHPLRDAGFGKRDVRRLARAYGLSVFDKPAQPCLASRLPVGVAVTAARLARVHRAERALRGFGFPVLRVRCEERHGRIEIAVRDLARAKAMRDRLEAAVKAAGFASASLDSGGYRPVSAGTEADSRPGPKAPGR